MPRIEIELGDYNIRPSNSRAANDTGIATLNARLQAEREFQHKLLMTEPGIIDVGEGNRIFQGVGDVVLEGLGISQSGWRNTRGAGNGRDSRPFHCRSIYEVYPYGQDWGVGISGYDIGIRIKTAKGGTEEIEIMFPADFGAIPEGARILAMAYNQQVGGEPPNLRWADVRRVLGVNNGILTLDGSIRQKLRQDLPDVTFDGKGLPEEIGPNVIGRARILLLDRLDDPVAPYYYPRRIELRNFSIHANPNYSAPDGVTCEAEVFRLHNVDVDPAWYVWPSQNVLFFATDCPRLGKPWDVDKLVDTVRIEGCGLQTIDTASGVRKVILRNNTIGHIWAPEGGRVALSAREVIVENNTIDARGWWNPQLEAASGSYGAWPSAYQSFKGNTIYVDDDVDYAWSSFGPISLAPDSVDGTYLELDFVEGAYNTEVGMFAEIMRNLMEGTRLHRAGVDYTVTNLLYDKDTNKVKIQARREDNNALWAPQMGEVYEFTRVNTVDWENNTVIGTPRVGLYRPSPGLVFNQI